MCVYFFVDEIIGIFDIILHIFAHCYNVYINFHFSSII